MINNFEIDFLSMFKHILLKLDLFLTCPRHHAKIQDFDESFYRGTLSLPSVLFDLFLLFFFPQESGLLLHVIPQLV